MPSKDLVDSDGNHFKVLDVDGYYIPYFSYPEQEEDFRSMVDHWEARDDDIILCNYPKSGTHWIWEIINMLYNQNAEFLDSTKEECMMECISKAKYDSMSSPRILNSHIYFSRLPKDIFKRKCKIIYSIRNPKDVAVSFYHHHRNIVAYEYEGTWENYFQRFINGYIDYHSWFDYVLDCNKVIEENKDYPFHVIQYEDMHLQCTTEVKRLAKFLDIQCDDKLAQDISNKCKLDVMKNAKKQNHDHWRGNTGMYRQGQVGRWKETFTIAQNEIFDKLYKEKMVDFPIKLKFTI